MIYYAQRRTRYAELSSLRSSKLNRDIDIGERLRVKLARVIQKYVSKCRNGDGNWRVTSDDTSVVIRPNELNESEPTGSDYEPTGPSGSSAKRRGRERAMPPRGLILISRVGSIACGKLEGAISIRAHAHGALTVHEYHAATLRAFVRRTRVIIRDRDNA